MSQNALRFGVPLIPHALGGMLISLADRLMIANLVGVAEAGIYTVSVQVGLVVLLLADGINRTVSPRIFELLKQDTSAANVQIVKIIYAFFAVMMVGGLVGAVVAFYALPLITGSAFGAAAAFVPSIAIGQATGGMYYMVSNLVF